MEEGGGLHNNDQIEMTFHVENRVDDDMGDEDDDMGDDDHDDAGLGGDYNDEMIDEEDDDFHENRVIETLVSLTLTLEYHFALYTLSCMESVHGAMFCLESLKYALIGLMRDLRGLAMATIRLIIML
ncbi:unnamed protein product [Dovyalis caffra]|uniref:Uncharacterized protein n=1 Tax=Dovyalis caffra TaxID=77055 RepID=A0AAV1SIG6_9ROSI|nr:unnamed protein product [Dovyalis caffra]